MPFARPGGLTLKCAIGEDVFPTGHQRTTRDAAVDDGSETSTQWPCHPWPGVGGGHTSGRRLIVTSLIKRTLKKILGRRILAGPFRGMRYPGHAATSVLMPKIVGTYEMELHPWLDARLQRLERSAIVVGAGEGFYAVGFLFRNISLRVRAYELDERARASLNESAVINHVRGRLVIEGACDPDSLSRALKEEPADLLLVDVEGYERDLLDPAVVPELEAQEIVVEVHDGIDPGITELLVSRFSTTHEITTILPRDRAVSDVGPSLYRWLASASPALARTLLWERAPGTSWMVLTPASSRE